MRFQCNISERIKFNSQLQTILARIKKTNSVAFLVLLDLVGFSFINYTYGYEFGDKVLMNVFLRITRIIGKEDLVRNFYSDDFFILLIDKDIDKNYKKLKNLEDLFKEPVIIKDIKIKLDTRICVIIFPQDISDEKDALNQIFMFSKLVKSERGTGTFFYKNYPIKVFNNIKNILEALKTMSLNNNLLVPAFQNIYLLREGRVYGCEVLARLFYNNQIYSAYQFINIVEHFNFIHKVDEIIFKKALEYKLKHNDSRVYFFNIHPAFMEKSLKIITNFLKEFTQKGLDPSQICIEFTESFEIKEPYRVNFLIEVCKKELNIKFALDDFGVGYSNIAAFTSLNIDILKIDRLLISNMTSNPKVVYLLKTFHDLSLLSNIILLGEGVETENELRLLNKLNYDLVQGYYFHKPSVPEEFKA